MENKYEKTLNCSKLNKRQDEREGGGEEEEKSNLQKGEKKGRRRKVLLQWSLLLKDPNASTTSPCLISTIFPGLWLSEEVTTDAYNVPEAVET
ncbi:unnamed protein product [Thlaspi arvense]|uniref:Uncharacterized protein n=1 Tax=Thlaspi arvense TaxID=13288 RepID=A0AAU9R899_THLAR|nr:unnamed protein product [Thlaspi arvense]